MRIYKLLLFLSLFLFLFTLVFTTSIDFNQDMGRHIKLAEIILRTGSVPSVNLFSYTNPDFPFINHHWLSEIIFYFFVTYVGVMSLVFLKVIVFFIALLLTFFSSLKKSTFLTASISFLLFIPLLLERSDVRPEIFGFVFFASLIYIFLAHSSNKKLLYLIPFIMFLWINIHISFIFGGIPILFLFIKIYLTNHKFYVDKKIIGVFILTPILMLLNPHGIYGLLYPLNIFTNYGYTIVENQNIFFLHEVTSNQNITYFFFLMPCVIISIGVLYARKKVFEGSVLIIFFLAAMYQIRHFPFFVLTAIPMISIALYEIYKIVIPYIPKKNKEKLSINSIRLTYLALITITIIISYLMINNLWYNTFDQGKKIGFDLKQDALAGTEFLLKNNLPQNIFNNFDVGGYLSYTIYPRYKLFVDNRPEAYPYDFLKNIYIPLQENPDIRKKVFDKYKIQTVFFMHTDQTPWGVQFLESILQDPKWKLVYADHAVVILSTNTRLADVRKDASYFASQINQSSDYMDLLHLARFFTFIGDSENFNLAIKKAEKINPSSCALNRILYQNYQSSSIYYLQADRIKSEKWYCF